MARRVFLHIGLPKTGTSYLQTIMWSHRRALRSAGLLVPGRERRDHLWSSLVVREDPGTARRNPRAAGSWDVLRREMRAWDRDAVVSHEFFCSASEEQARRTVEQLAPAEVHVVVTAREPLSLFTSSWQESLKNKSTTPLEEYAREVSDDPTVVWNWRALDLGLVLRRWTTAVPPDQVHVITPPASDAPRAELWDRWCSVLGLDVDVDASGSGFANASLGVVEAETLRRLNGRLAGFGRARDRGVWIRTFLADERLVPHGGERFWPDEDQQEDCRRRGQEAVAFVREQGFDVVGDLDSLLVPDDVPPRRHPSSVTDAEVADVALDLAARLMRVVRKGVGAPTSQATGAAPAGGSDEDDADPARWREVARRLKVVLRRS